MAEHREGLKEAKAMKRPAAASKAGTPMKRPAAASKAGTPKKPRVATANNDHVKQILAVIDPVARQSEPSAAPEEVEIKITSRNEHGIGIVQVCLKNGNTKTAVAQATDRMFGSAAGAMAMAEALGLLVIAGFQKSTLMECKRIARSHESLQHLWPVST